MKCIEKYLNENILILQEYFSISLLSKNDIFDNPLVYATERVNNQLEEGGFINENQLRRLNLINPFYVLKYNKFANKDNIVYF
jgi:hypothetical protein